MLRAVLTACRYGLLALLLASAARAEPVLRVGYFDLPPHAQGAGPAEAGLAVRYFERIARQMGVHAEYRSLPLARLLLMLERNELDMALILARNPERAARFSYPARPLLLSHPVIVVRRDGGIRSVQQLRSEAHWQVGIYRGGYQSGLLGELAGTPILLAGEAVTERGMRMVQAGRLDAFFSPDDYAVAHVLRDRLLAQQLRVLAADLAPLPLYSVFSPRAAPRYQAAYEQALARVQAEQPYAALLSEALAAP